MGNKCEYAKITAYIPELNKLQELIEEHQQLTNAMWYNFRALEQQALTITLAVKRSDDNDQ